MDGEMDGWADGLMSRWMDGEMDGWAGGWTDEWMLITRGLGWSYMVAVHMVMDMVSVVKLQGITVQGP